MRPLWCGIIEKNWGAMYDLDNWLTYYKMRTGYPDDNGILEDFLGIVQGWYGFQGQSP
jgi:hypothetical protein